VSVIIDKTYKINKTYKIEHFAKHSIYRDTSEASYIAMNIDV